MTESILLINTMQVEQGKLEGFKESVKSSLAFVQANGLNLMVEVYVDEENLRAYSIQFYGDSESILSHWRMSDPYIRDVMQPHQGGAIGRLRVSQRRREGGLEAVL